MKFRKGDVVINTHNNIDYIVVSVDDGVRIKVLGTSGTGWTAHNPNRFLILKEEYIIDKVLKKYNCYE
jgi:hypothetical protein